MNFKHILLSLASAVTLLLSSCQPDEYSLSTPDVKPDEIIEGIAYKITHDASNPNIVYLESLMDRKYQALWITPQGRSQSNKVTLKVPFAGTYDVIFGVQTRGGYVYGDTAQFKIENMYADFISDPLWTLLTGGIGKSKTWVLDLNADGVSKYFAGPLFFYGTGDWWGTVNGTGSKLNDDSWNWSPDYKGNSWLMTAGDYGTMTFDLIDGAHVTVDHKILGRSEKGTYLLDSENKTLGMTDAAPLHDSGRDGVVINWGDLRIMSLTENTLQLAALRDPALSGEGACLLVYNFISKEYADNWVAPETEDPEPALPENWESSVSQTVSKSIVWKLSEETPLNWCKLDGSLMNTWNAASDYPDWLGKPDAATYGKFSLTLNSDDKTAIFVAPDGTKVNTSYTLNEKGIYTFANAAPEFSVISWANFKTDNNNQLRIMQIETDATGNVTGMWVGAKDATKPEYMAYHLIPSAGAATADPLKAWKTALVGKTFKPDVNWFVDWINFDQTGGWTSASTFGTDYTSNAWVWTEKTSSIAKSASIKFTSSGDDIMATLTQDLYDADGNLVTAGYSVSGKVTINNDNPSLTFNFPLVDYTGSPGNWLNKSNPKGQHFTTALNENEWLFVSHGGSNLSKISTDGIWLGAVINAIASGDSKDELLIFHYVLAE